MDDSLKFTVYQITNLVNGKIYIGKHQTTDLIDDYMGSGKLINQAIKKYGKENFKKEILFIFDNEQEMNEKEAELVTEEFVKLDSNYNLCVGGQGGFSYINSKDRTWSIFKTDKSVLDKAIENRRDTLRKLNSDPNWRKMVNEKISSSLVGRDLKGFTGKTHSEETKSKMSKTRKKNGHSKGSKNSQYGKRWIYSLEEKRSWRIDKNDSLPEGCFEGRKIKFL